MEAGRAAVAETDIVAHVISAGKMGKAVNLQDLTGLSNRLERFLGVVRNPGMQLQLRSNATLRGLESIRRRAGRWMSRCLLFAPPSLRIDFGNSTMQPDRGYGNAVIAAIEWASESALDRSDRGPAVVRADDCGGP